MLALSTMELLINALRSLDADPAVRIVVLKAEGPVFSSGHDLRELAPDRTAEDHARIFALSSELNLLIQGGIRVPVLASVRGLAAASGCQLVASCDLVIAAQSATFSVPGVRQGLFCTTPGVALTRALTNQKLAMQMLFTGEPITAQEAYLHGLVGKVVPDEKLEEETRALAEKVASLSSAVQGLGKRAYYTQRRARDAADAYRFAEKQMVANLHELADGGEGIRAFIEKRAPRWSHR